MFFTKYKNELRVGIKIRVVNRSHKDDFKNDPKKNGCKLQMSQCCQKILVLSSDCV